MHDQVQELDQAQLFLGCHGVLGGMGWVVVDKVERYSVDLYLQREDEDVKVEGRGIYNQM